MKKFHCKALLLTAGLAISSLFLSSGASADSNFDDLSKTEIVEQMGAGWNLGNQLEASNNTGQGETLWGNPVISKAGLQAVKDAGFNTVRIPVSWLAKIGSAPNYTIDTQWLNRVQEVVDYAIDSGLYVLLDVHNDGSISVNGSWIHTNTSNQAPINDKLEKVWTQIATRFKDYDEHLIFEGMNEVGAESGNSETEIREAISYINAYNETFVNAVRKTGGNNDKRWLMIPGWNTNVDYTAGDFGFKVPKDTYLSSSIPSGEKRLLVSVHYYSPWEFAGMEDGVTTTWGSSESNTITWANEDYMKSQFKKMHDKFYTDGYPVVIGEYGSVDKSQYDSKNANSRAYYARTVCKFSKEYHCVPVYWDNGHNGNFGMGLFNRHDNYAVTEPFILSAIMHYYGSPTGSTITVQNKKITMELGDTPASLSTTLTPASSNQWIEYKSSDESVASVDRYGKITPTGIGTATITASVNGSSDTSRVTVTAPSATRVKLYMQNSSNWTTTSSDGYVSIDKNGSYTLSISGSRSEMSNVTLLYIQDIGSFLGSSNTSKINSANIKVDSIKFNGTACTTKNSEYSVSSNDSFYVGLINTWGNSDITNITKASGNDGYAFTDVNYQDTNTIEVKFTVKNAAFSSSGSSSGGSDNEQIIFNGTGSYSTDNASWLINAADSAVITIKYHATDAEHAGWGVLGWGASVDGEWVSGPVYSASTSKPESSTTVTTTAKALRQALNISSGSSVSYLSLSPYNSGVLESITIQ